MKKRITILFLLLILTGCYKANVPEWIEINPPKGGSVEYFYYDTMEYGMYIDPVNYGPLNKELEEKCEYYMIIVREANDHFRKIINRDKTTDLWAITDYFEDLNQTLYTEYDSDKNLIISEKTYNNEEGKEIKKEYLNEEGSVINAEEYYYDENGRNIRTDYLDRDGEMVYTEIIVYALNGGYFSYSYDKNGVLTSWCDFYASTDECIIYETADDAPEEYKHLR